MKTVPGTIGWPVVGDKSIQFYSDPENFLQSELVKNQSSIFQTRILNQPTIFVCGFNEVNEILNEKAQDFENGYHTFLFNSYGENILFKNGKPAHDLHAKLANVFAKNNLFIENVQQIIASFVDGLSKDEHVNVYSACKLAMTRLCLRIFLDMKDEDTLMIETISSLTTLHWHGIISLPVNVKMPFGKTGWNKALEAKAKLIELIRQKIKTKDINNKSTSFFAEMFALFSSPTEFENHILLFISALIPKAFASLYTSFIYELSGSTNLQLRKRCLENDDCLRNVLLEVQRMYPPFIGGRRITIKDTSIGAYKIPKGYSVIYIAQYAQRDKSVFIDPDNFLPERWTKCDQSLFCFGNGKRECVGIHLIMEILTVAAKQTLSKMDWQLAVNKPIVYKLLPVSRPRNEMLVNFKNSKN